MSEADMSEADSIPVNDNERACFADEKIEGARQAYETTLSSGLNFFDTAGK